MFTVTNQSRNISADEGQNLFYTKYVWLPLAPKERKTHNLFSNASIQEKNTSNIHNICHW